MTAQIDSEALAGSSAVSLTRGSTLRDNTLQSCGRRRPTSFEESLLLQLAQDHRNGLRRLARAAGHVDPGHRPVALQHGQKQAFVLVVNPTLVHAAACAPDFATVHCTGHSRPPLCKADAQGFFNKSNLDIF